MCNSEMSAIISRFCLDFNGTLPDLFLFYRLKNSISSGELCLSLDDYVNSDNSWRPFNNEKSANMWNVMWSTMLCIATMATFQVRHYSWPFILLPPRDSPTSHKGSRRRYKDPAQDDSSITPLKNDLTCVAGTRSYLRSYFWMTDDTGISWWRQFDVAQLLDEGHKVSDLYCIRGDNKLRNVKISANIASVQFDLFFLPSETWDCTGPSPDGRNTYAIIHILLEIRPSFGKGPGRACGEL